MITTERLILRPLTNLCNNPFLCFLRRKFRGVTVRGHPLFLCLLCLFLEFGDFLFLLFYHLGKLRFAFFSCFCVHVEFLSLAVGESWEGEKNTRADQAVSPYLL